MAEIKSGVNPLFLREEVLREAIELLYFGYRDFTSDADVLLADSGLGRAHHRIIYFVGRHPRLSVSELLSILKITKQSLSRVLAELVEGGFVVQSADGRDRRRRLLELTDKGRALERQLTERQRIRIANAFRSAGADAVEGFRKVMLHLVDAADRSRFARAAEAAGDRAAPAATTPPSGPKGP